MVLVVRYFPVEGKRMLGNFLQTITNSGVQGKKVRLGGRDQASKNTRQTIDKQANRRRQAGDKQATSRQQPGEGRLRRGWATQRNIPIYIREHPLAYGRVSEVSQCLVSELKGC